MTNERAPGDGYLVLWAGSTEVNERDAQVELRRAGVRVEVVEVDALGPQVNARAPDLVVLGGTLGEEPEELAATLAASSPGAVVPILALAPPSAASPRPRARYGLVARFDRELPPSTLASHVSKLLAALSTRSPTWRVSLRGNDLGPLAARLARSGRAGILTVESGAMVVQARGPIAPRTHEVEPGHAQFHERPADRVRVLDAITSADTPTPSLDGVRALLIDDDADRRDAAGRRLEEAGAQVRATGLVAQAVHASRVHDPAVIVVGVHALRSGAVLPLWSEQRLTAASLLVVDERLMETEQDALVREVASLAGPAATLSARLGAQEALAERLETLGPARWLKVLGRCEHDVTLRVFGAEGRARVDLTGGRIRGASFRPRAEGEVIDGRAAVDALMAMQFGRVLVGPPNALAALDGVSARRKPSVVGRIESTSSTESRRAQRPGSKPLPPKGTVPKPRAARVDGRRPLAPTAGASPDVRRMSASKGTASKGIVPKPIAAQEDARKSRVSNADGSQPNARGSEPLSSSGGAPKPIARASKALTSNAEAPKPLTPTARVPKPSADPSQPEAPQPEAPSAAARARLADRPLAETVDELATPGALGDRPLAETVDELEAPASLGDRPLAETVDELATPASMADRPLTETADELEAPASLSVPLIDLAEGNDAETGVYPPDAMEALRAATEREPPTPDVEIEAPLGAPPREPSDAPPPLDGSNIATALPPVVEASAGPSKRGKGGVWFAAGILVALGVGGWAVWQLQTAHRPSPETEVARRSSSGVETPTLGAAPTPAEGDPGEPARAEAAPEDEPVEREAQGGVEGEAIAAETTEDQPVELEPLAEPASEPPPHAPDDRVPSGEVNVFGLLEEARAAGRAGDYARSERLSRQALEASPNNPRAGYRLAVSLFRLSRYEEAIRQAERTIRWDPDDPLPVALIGDIHCHRGRFARGARFYRRALEVDPAFDPAERALERLRARGIQ